MRNLLIRADGGEKVGMGHLVRCRALAQAWQDAGGEVRFATSGESAEETSLKAASIGAEWVVVDGYQFDSTFVDTLKQSGLRVLFIDDCGCGDRYPADLILNQNLHASEALYTGRAPSTGLLLGPRYALLRREFLRSRRDSEAPALARKILVTMGGADPDNVTAKVIRAIALLEMADLEAAVVVGPVNPHHAAIRRFAAKQKFGIRVERDPADMPGMLAWADIAISAAGSTCWELAFMGLPAIVMVCAANQHGVARSLAEAGSAESLGEHGMVSSRDIAASIKCFLRSQRIRQSMAKRGRALVDGRGAERVVECMLKRIHFREVEERDCRLLWQWVNDSAVRRSAFSSDPIAWQAHVEWFDAKRKDACTVQWIALDDSDTPIGQVRFDGNQQRGAVIDVSIAAEQRAKGYGGMVIAAAVERLFHIGEVDTVHAMVKTQNQPSLRAFRNAGFEDLGIETVNGYQAEHLVRRRQHV